MIFDPIKYSKHIAGIEAHWYSPTKDFEVETVQQQLKAARMWKNLRQSLHNQLTFSEDERIDYQLRQLRKLVSHAYTKTSFYRRLYSSVGFEPGDLKSLAEFSLLPSIGRDDLITSFPNDILSARFSPSSLLKCRSSGSSGKPVPVVQTHKRARYDTVFRYRQFEKMVGHQLDPSRWIYNIHFSPWWYSSFNGQYPVFTMAPSCPPDLLYKHLSLLRPAVVSATASALQALASLQKPLHVLGIEAVSSNSETSTSLERKTWSEVFGTPVLDEYSSEELDLLASQCREGIYHIVEDDAYVEIIDMDSEGVGDVVGTDMYNFAMPIIRYRTGDLLSFGSGKTCACKCTFRQVMGLQGRADQAFYKFCGERVPPGHLLQLCDEYLTPESSGIKEYRVVQLENKKIQLLIVPDSSYPGSTIQTSAQKFAVKISSVLHAPANSVDTTILAQLPPNKSYKRKTLISLVSSHRS